MNRTQRHSSRRSQVDLSLLVSHPAQEIAVGRGDDPGPVGRDSLAGAKTGSAGGTKDIGPCFQEVCDNSLPDGLKVDLP